MRVPGSHAGPLGPASAAVPVRAASPVLEQKGSLGAFVYPEGPIRELRSGNLSEVFLGPSHTPAFPHPTPSPNIAKSGTVPSRTWHLTNFTNSMLIQGLDCM